MSRAKLVLLVLLPLVVVAAGAGYWFFQVRAQPDAGMALLGLAAVPADAGLVGGIDLEALRQRQWLMDSLREASADVQEAPDYRAFVEATGFDYTRDLSHVWLGASGTSQQPALIVLAEGRYARDRIAAYARKEGATPGKYREFDVYQVRTPPPQPDQPERRVSFAFLDDEHLLLAFGPDGQLIERAIDAWQSRAPAFTSDPARRAEVERLAAGQHVWSVAEMEKWKTTQPAGQKAPVDPGLAELVSQVALGLNAGDDGVRLSAEARCHQEADAERLHSNLLLLSQLGRLAFSRDKNEQSQALAETLGNLNLSRDHNTVQAHVLVSRSAMATFLRPPAKTPAAPGSPSSK
ncbi:MAG TPA: DUF3352 domain-containing protein [Candidatus Xenobia bacterium]|nr:DUF3352 domain-containing protein [Candidatus Xenobia bacterium]